MPNINLDAARAARREADGEAPTLTLGGKVYDLVVELPKDLLKSIAGIAKMPDEIAPGPDATPEEKAVAREQQAQVLEVLDALAMAMLGPAYEEVSPQLSVNDLMTMLEELAPVYGFETPGESSASAASS